MADPIAGLSLEAAIESAVGPLTQLFAAEAAWDAAMRAHMTRQWPRGARPPPDPECKRTHLAYLAEVAATLEPFRRKLAAGEWTVDIRPLHEIGAQLKRLRPGEASQLMVDVHKNALSVHGPHGEKLYAEFSPAPSPVKRWHKKPPQAVVDAKVRELAKGYAPGQAAGRRCLGQTEGQGLARAGGDAKTDESCPREISSSQRRARPPQQDLNRRAGIAAGDLAA
jgi:hypothetical protein